MDAADYLHSIEKKLEIVQCDDREKVLFTTHYLAGPAASWWDNFRSMQPDERAITWEIFKDKFTKNHIPSGLIGIKKKEFRALKQGSMTVTEYLHKFIQLSRYAKEDVNTEDAKLERFLDGLQQSLQCQLVTHDFPDLQTMVNKTLILEEKRRTLEDTRKRKKSHQIASRGNQKPRTWQHTTPRFTGSLSNQEAPTARLGTSPASVVETPGTSPVGVLRRD